VHYKCADGGSVTAKYIQGDPPTAKVVAGSTTYYMTLEPAGGGAKYSDGKATWWTKGNEGTFELGGVSTVCTQ
jgi:membrane-bound inhibitor of C-type lysozyme